jgi:hypothetical protein
MASIRFTDVQARPSEFLDLTSLTLEEFHQWLLLDSGVLQPFPLSLQAQ